MCMCIHTHTHSSFIRQSGLKEERSTRNWFRFGKMHQKELRLIERWKEKQGQKKGVRDKQLMLGGLRSERDFRGVD